LAAISAFSAAILNVLHLLPPNDAEVSRVDAEAGTDALFVCCLAITF